MIWQCELEPFRNLAFCMAAHTWSSFLHIRKYHLARIRLISFPRILRFIVMKNHWIEIRVARIECVFLPSIKLRVQWISRFTLGNIYGFVLQYYLRPALGILHIISLIYVLKKYRNERHTLMIFNNLTKFIFGRKDFVKNCYWKLINCWLVLLI